ncbi:MAG: hypothetical protein M0Z73_07565 [Betaproteobacteria bacterium]|nr:hypothetical protein [Betaproteobacteria bacterium]
MSFVINSFNRSTALTETIANNVREISTVQEVVQATTFQPIYTPGKITPVELMQANPVIGKVDIRTTAIAERLKDPASAEARDYALSSRQQAVSAILQLMQQLTAEDGGVTPGLFAGIRVYGLVRPVAATTGDPTPAPIRDPFLDFIEKDDSGKIVLDKAPGNFREFAQFNAHPLLLTKLLESPQVTVLDEAEHFSQTTDVSDNSVVLLRQFEANVLRYRNLLNRCVQALNDLRQADADTTSRLDAAGDRVAEARHDVSVARALMAEEEDRIAAVNARRAQVLAQEVPFLAYMRPREADNLIPTFTHAVDPGLVDAPVPACLRELPDVPDELTDMLRVLREAPANWFVKAPPLLHRLDKIDQLVRLVQSAQMRAAAGVATPLLAARALGTGKLVDAIAGVATRQAAALAPRLAAVRGLNLASFASATWQGIRTQAEPAVSFGDLAEGGHGRPDVARAAAAELENFRRIVACLHAEFSAIPAVMRLEWADTLSEFDAAPNLRNLGNLPRWAEIAYLDRRQMQAYVDWLFAQIQVAQPQAVALINDVVRMCLLLASHAPVDRIIAGHMARPVTGVGVGVHIPLAVANPSRLRVGMQALLYRGADLIARAQVADIGALEVTAEVIHTVAARVDLGNDVSVHFDNAASVSLSSASAVRTLFAR